MSEGKIEIFLSSDQHEFARVRINLSTTLCEIPFLNCIPLENRGADSTDILESSLRAARHSDVYVGIFGLQYSAITAEEFREAVKWNKPCFIYVKKSTDRSEQLQKFIEDEVKSRFKYHEFKTNSDMSQQVVNDLKKFVVETLKFGIAVRSRKKDQAQALIKKEETAASTSSSISGMLNRAERAFKTNNYLECLVVSIVVLETTLKDALLTKGIVVENPSIGTLVRFAVKNGLINSMQENSLQEISYIRNKAVHMGEVPKESDAYKIVQTTKQVVEYLSKK